MLEEIIDDTKKMLNIPVMKSMDELYFVIDKITKERVLDSSGKPLIITKYQINKIRNDYIAISMIDYIKKNYENNFKNKMKYDSMSDEEKTNLLTKQLNEAHLNKKL